MAERLDMRSIEIEDGVRVPMGKVGNCARAVAVLVRDGRVVVSQACPNDHKDAKQTDLLYSMCLPGRSCAGVGRTNGIARLLLGCILQMNTLCTTHTTSPDNNIQTREAL